MRRNRLRFYFIYTSVFIAFCLGVFIVFLRNGKSMVWDVDGQPQYLPYLIYMGREIRSFFSRALQGDLRLKMIEYSIGMGADVSTVFRSHPLDFLSALVPAAYTQYLYSFIQIFSMYLAGIAFSALGFYWQQSERAVLLGTMVYLFGRVISQGLLWMVSSMPQILKCWAALFRCTPALTTVSTLLPECS